MFMHYTFNRGISAITVGGEVNNGNFNLNSDAPPPVTWAVATANNGFSTASLSLNIAASQQSENYSNGPYLKYDSTVSPDQDEEGSDTTALVWLNPTYMAQGGIATPYADLDVYYFLLGDQAGTVWLYSLNTTTGQTSDGSQVDSLGGGGISDILSIPNMNTVVVLTFHGTIYTYSIEWNGLGGNPPNPTYNPIFTLMEEQTEFEDSTDDADQQGYLPRSMSGVQYNDTLAYVYICGLYGNNQGGNMAVFELRSDNNIFQLLSTIHTGACYQSIPTIYGLYFATNGNAVGFIPWASPSEDPAIAAYYGMLDSTAYIVQNFGNNTVASIAFSPNTNNVVQVMNPLSGQTKSYYEGGALFVAVIPSAILSDGAFYHDGDYIGPEALSDIYMHDPCTGETSLWINQLVQGPAYSMLADPNMNLIIQNGNNGLTTLSVPYIPGFASLGTWILNNAYACGGSSSKWLAWLNFVLAVAGVCFGVLGEFGIAAGPIGAAFALGVAIAGAVGSYPNI